MRKNIQESIGAKPINVGLIGFGNIGKGVVKYFQDGYAEPFNVHLKKVAVADPAKPREVSFDHVTGNVADIFNDPSINIVVELIGGLDPARKYILDAIGKGKSVVTANKAVMARYAGELFEAARSEFVDIAFEASVGGGIPIINTLSRYKGDKIQKVMGVLNGTTNFILTQMEEGLDFDTALKIAQDRGFAEANHILDTGGYDTRDKLALLASLIFNAQIDPEKISCRGITDITRIDLDFAAQYEVAEGGKGYAVKLLAVADRKDDRVELRVNPALIRKDHPLTAVRDEVNAIYIEPQLAGPQVFQGKGAGTNPTTSAVVSDILRVASNIQKGITDDLPKLDSGLVLVDLGEVKQRGYIRTNLKHLPGSIAQVATIIAKHDLNIEHSVQNKKYEMEVGGEKVIPDIITIEPISRRLIDTALTDLAHSDRIEGKPFFMSIEE